MPVRRVPSSGTAQREAAHNEPAPPAELPVDATHALFPGAVLGEGEVILLFLKPSLWFVPLTCLGSISAALVVVSAALWAGASLPIGGVGRGELVPVVISLLGARVGWQLLEWLSHTYILTDRRVIRIRGVLRSTAFDAPFPRLADPVLHVSGRERLLGLGTIHFATRSRPGDDGSEETTAEWRMVRKPDEVYRTVVQTLHRYRGGAGHGT